MATSVKDCTKCGKVTHNLTRTSWCHACHADASRDRQRERKAALIEMMGGACEDCGITGHPAIFDFHHTDPAEKRFTIGCWLNGPADRLVEESTRCVLLCANCHRVRTARDDYRGHGR